MKFASSLDGVPGKFFNRKTYSLGLVGGGCVFSRDKCSWCAETECAEKGEDLSLLKGPMLKAISRISSGINEQDYLKLCQGLELIKKVRIKDIVNPVIDLTKLIEILSRKYLSGFPQTIREKIAAIIPYILCFLINNMRQSFTESLKADLLNKLIALESQVNINHLGGPELQFYYEVSIWFLKTFPTSEETKNTLYDVYGTLKDLSAIILYGTNPSELPTDAITSLGEKFVDKIQDDLWDERLVNFFSVQNEVNNLNIDPFNMESLDIIFHLGTSGDYYTSVAALLGLKKVLLNEFHLTIFEKSLGFVQEMCFKKPQVRPVAIRMCIELANAEYMSEGFKFFLAEAFNPSGKIFKTDSNLLVRSLIANRTKIKAYLETFEENWQALTGIDEKDHNEMIDLYRKYCFQYTYIKLKVSEQHKSQVDLFEDKIQEFLHNKEQKVCLLLGEAGSGKTVLSRKLALDLLETKNDYLPIYISLLRVKEYLQDIVRVAMAWYSIDPNSIMIRYRSILFILDGYDQLSIMKNIITSNNIYQSFPECKVLITCRKFECPGDSYFIRNDININQAMKQLCKLYIQPLSPGQIEEFLKLNGKDPGLVMNLNAFASNPMLLSLCTSNAIVLGELLNHETASKPQIVKEFISQFQQKEIKSILENPTLEMNPYEIKNLPARYTELSTKYALSLLRNGTIDINTKESIFMRGVPLCKTEDSIEFIHASIADYFIAMHLTALLQSEDATSFLNEYDFRYKHNIASFIPEDPSIIQSLTKITRNSKEGMASSNAISLLNLTGYNFFNQNWMGIQIRGANLSRANLWNTNFGKSDMRETNLKDSRLLMTNLSECNLIDVDLGVLPSIFTEASVCSVSFASSNAKIAAGCLNGMVGVWDLSTGSQMFSQMTSGKKTCVVFSPDSQMIAFGNEFTVVLQLNPMTVLLELSEHSYISAVDFSTNNKAIASGGEDGTVNVREIMTQSLLCSCKHTAKVVGVQFYRNLIASASIDGLIIVWNIQGKTLYTFNQAYIASLSFNGKLLVSAGESIHIYKKKRLLSKIPEGNVSFVKILNNWIISANGQIKIWEVDSGRLVYAVYVGSPVLDIDASPDGRLIAYGTENRIKFIEIDKLHNNHIKCVKCSEDNRFIVSLDSHIKIWSIERGELIRTINPNMELELITINSDASLVAGYGKNIHIWRSGVLQESLWISAAKVFSIALSEKEDILICYIEEGKLFLKNVTTDTSIFSMQISPEMVKKIDFSPYMLMFAIAYDNDIYVYEEETQIFSKNISILGLSLSKDGSKLATCDLENLSLWKIRTKEILRSVRSGPHFCVSLFTNSKFIVTGKSDLAIWNMSDISNTFGRAKAAFSPDGLWLAWKTGTEIKVWKQGVHVHSFGAKGGKNSELAFINDCICLIDSNDFVYAWKLEDGSPEVIDSVDKSRSVPKFSNDLLPILWRSSACVYASNIDLAIINLKNYLSFRQNDFII